MADFKFESKFKAQGFSESVTVAAGSDRLARRKRVATLVILTQLPSQKGFNDLSIWGNNKSFFFSHEKETELASKLLLTKAALMASLILIIRWSQSKNITQKQTSMF